MLRQIPCKHWIIPLQCPYYEKQYQTDTYASENEQITFFVVIIRLFHRQIFHHQTLLVTEKGKSSNKISGPLYFRPCKSCLRQIRGLIVCMMSTLFEILPPVPAAMNILSVNGAQSYHRHPTDEYYSFQQQQEVCGLLRILLLPCLV